MAVEHGSIGNDVSVALDEGIEQLEFYARRLEGEHEVDAGCAQKLVELFVGGISYDGDVAYHGAKGRISPRDDEAHFRAEWHNLLENKLYDPAVLLHGKVSVI